MEKRSRRHLQHIKEPLNVDFYFDTRQMTVEDQKRVTEFIARQKNLNKKRPLVKTSASKKRPQRETA